MKNNYISLIDSYKLCLQIAGKRANAFKKTVIFYIFTYIFQGFCFIMFYPFLKAIFSKDLHVSLFWMGGILICFILSLFSRYKANAFDHDAEPENVKINHDLRVAIGKKLRSMPLEKLYSYRTGELNSILLGGVEESVMMLGMIWGMILEAIIIPCMIIGFAFFVNFKIALALLVIFPFAIPIYKYKRRINLVEKQTLRAANEKLESNIIEYIQGISVLKSLNLIGKNAKTLSKSIQEVKQEQEKTIFQSSLSMLGVGIVVQVAVLVCLGLGVNFVLGGSLEASALVVLVVWASRVLDLLSYFLAFVSIADLIDVSFGGIKKLLNIKDLEIKGEEVPKSFDIEFKNVNFSYEGANEMALKDINFKIKEKSFTAIVGDSGSGKTTISKLLMRYATPQQGVIKMGGVDIKNIKYEELMRHISVVFQDVYLFDDTILNNIKMANENVSDEEVKNAAKLAFCHEFIIKLPKGYDTLVGEIGGRLSGGEKQRISIARAILKNSSIVILDEPTSALDTKSEVAVQKALNSLLKNKTIIVIAHRLSTITGADQILVMENNTIVQYGQHEKLLKIQGKYKNMTSAQKRVKEWSTA